MAGKSTTQTSPTEVRNLTWPRRDLRSPDGIVDFSWNVMAHCDARRGIEGGKFRMQWVASTLRTTSEHAVSNITTADAHTSAASSRLNWRPPAEFNGLVRLTAKSKSGFPSRVPSHFKHSLETRKDTRSALGSLELRIPRFVTSSWNFNNNIKIVIINSNNTY